MKENIEEKLKLYRGEYYGRRNLQQSNVVRIFISSTFTDMKFERNILIEKAYPELRAFCQSKHLDFQVIDMRWGIQDSASIDHSTPELCLMEIKACRRLSIGPYFVAFLGNRYGYKPLPTTILSSEFNEISNSIEDKSEIDLINLWYIEDKNMIPAKYVLQPIDKILPGFREGNSVEGQKAAQTWKQTSKEIENILLQSIHKVKAKKIQTEDEKKLICSVTEMEIQEGYMRQLEGTQMYDRNISDVSSNIDDNLMSYYVDMKKQNIDYDSQDLLKILKSSVEDTADDDRLRKYDIQWSGITSEDADHKCYLNTFCGDFVKDMKHRITESIKDKDFSSDIKNDDLFQEVIHHQSFAFEKSESFCGRHDLINEITSVLLNDENSNPVALFGESGSGKTSLMAKINEVLKRDQNYVHMIRFFGTTPNSSQIHLVLKNLILQICFVFEFEEPPSHLLQSFVDVTQIFEKILVQTSDIIKEKREGLLIILDSIDQLSPNDGAYRLNWLPKSLPPGVKILISTLPDPNIGCLKLLTRILPPTNLIQISKMTLNTGEEILNNLLSKVQRTLTKEQRTLIIDSFIRCSSPLFMKLAFDEAKLWNSYTEKNELKLGGSVREAIQSFFNRLEVKHGFIFTSRAIGYLVAAKNGIMENELDDLLSLDDEVLDNCYQYWSPPNHQIVRIPTLLWIRLRHDLGENLVERQADGKTVLSFYHRQFFEVARKRYLTDETKNKIHTNFSLYFLGTYSDGKKKPLKLKIWNSESKLTDRKVSSQPLVYFGGMNNLRKMNELPYHLLHASHKSDLLNQFSGRVLCEEVLFNVKWISTKVAASSIKDVLDDYEMVLELFPYKPIKLVFQALKIAKPTLEFPGGVKNSLTTEMFGRLNYFRGKFKETLDQLLDECDKINHDKVCGGLIPLNAGFQPPGGELQTTLIGLSKPVTCVATRNDNLGKGLLAAVDSVGSIIVWKLGTDEVLHTISSNQDKVLKLMIAGPRLISASAKHQIVVFDLDTGAYIRKIKQSHDGYQDHFSITASLKEDLIITGCGDRIIIQSVLERKEMIFQKTPLCNLSSDIIFDDVNNLVYCGYKDGGIISLTTQGIVFRHFHQHQLRLNGKQIKERFGVSKLHLLKESLIAFWDYKIVAEIQPQSETFIATNKCDDHEISIFDSNAELMCLGTGNSVNIWNISTHKYQRIASLRFHEDSITSLSFLPTSEQSSDLLHLVVGSRDCNISIWSINKMVDHFKINDVPSDVISGMGATIDFIVPVKAETFITASSNVFYLKIWNISKNIKTSDTNSKKVTFPITQTNHAVSNCGNKLALYHFNSSTVDIFDITLAPKSQLVKTFFLGYRTFIKELPKSILVRFSKDDRFIFCCLKNAQTFVLSAHQKSQKNEVRSNDLTNSLETVVTTAEISLDDKYIVLSFVQDKENSLIIVAADTLKSIYLLALNGYGISGSVTCTHVSSISDNLNIFIGCNKGQINIFKFINKGSALVKSNSFHQRLNGHVDPLTVLRLTPNEGYLLSGTTGKVRQLWIKKNGRWNTKQMIKSDSILNSEVTAVTFFDEDKFFAVGSHERNVRIYRSGTGEEVAAQYVYASVIGISVVHDRTLIIRTSQGFIIKNLFCFQKSQTNF